MQAISQKVKLTNTVYLSKNELMLDSLSNYPERWAKVTISDGTRTETMVGRYDRNYFPPFVYTTYDMRGEIGKEYTLRVETPGWTGGRGYNDYSKAGSHRQFSCRAGDGGQFVSNLCLHKLQAAMQTLFPSDRKG